MGPQEALKFGFISYFLFQILIIDTIFKCTWRAPQVDLGAGSNLQKKIIDRHFICNINQLSTLQMFNSTVVWKVVLATEICHQQSIPIFQMTVEGSISVLKSLFVSQMKGLSIIFHWRYEPALKSSCGALHVHLKIVSIIKIW